jgi:hypothetical protein
VLDVDNTITPPTISCNGVKIFCRGGNWGWDEPLRRVPPDRMAQTVAMHRDMNFTMIRNWIGGGNREELYAACDENGILIWNDFWDDGDIFPDDRPGYVAMATDTIQRYRIHPCIAVWCGANEAPPPDLNAGLANAVATENPEVYYQGNSASRRCGTVRPRLVADQQPAGRHVSGGDQRPARRVEDARGLLHEGAVRQLREHARDLRGVDGEPVAQHLRRAAVDVAPGLAQHRGRPMTTTSTSTAPTTAPARAASRCTSRRTRPPGRRSPRTTPRSPSPAPQSPRASTASTAPCSATRSSRA